MTSLFKGRQGLPEDKGLKTQGEAVPKGEVFWDSLHSVGFLIHLPIWSFMLVIRALGVEFETFLFATGFFFNMLMLQPLFKAFRLHPPPYSPASAPF